MTPESFTGNLEEDLKTIANWGAKQPRTGPSTAKKEYTKSRRKKNKIVKASRRKNRRK